MSSYVVKRTGADWPRHRGTVTVEVANEQGRHPLLHHVHHSPDGFEFGYGGSGPAELARCILWDHLGHEPAPATYQDLKDVFLIDCPSDGFVLHGHEIQAWLDSRKASA